MVGLLLLVCVTRGTTWILQAACGGYSNFEKTEYFLRQIALTTARSVVASKDNLNTTVFDYNSLSALERRRAFRYALMITFKCSLR